MKLRGPTGVAAVGVLLTLVFGHLLGPFDLLTFLQAGRDVLHGRSPYAAPDSPVFRSGHAFVYPLYVAWLFAPLAALPRQVAEVVYGVGSLGAIVAGCRLLGRVRWGTAGLVLVSSTTIIGLQMGTLNAFLLLGIACAWHWRDTRPRLAGILLGAAATAKLFLLPVLLWPILRRRFGLAASSLATVAGLMVASAALGSLSPLAYLQMMSRLDARERVTSWSLSSFLQGLGAGPGWATAGSVLVVAVVVAGLFRWRRRLGDARLLGAAVVCGLLLSPILWSSYLLLLAVPLLLSGRDRLVAVFTLASWAMVTPDAASAPRVAAGVAAAAAVAVAVVRPRLTLWVPAARPRIRREVLAFGSVPAAFAVLMLLLPAPARSPLPALFVTALVAAWCLRPAHRAEALEPSLTGPSASGDLRGWSARVRDR